MLKLLGRASLPRARQEAGTALRDLGCFCSVGLVFYEPVFVNVNRGFLFYSVIIKVKGKFQLVLFCFGARPFPGQFR